MMLLPLCSAVNCLSPAMPTRESTRSQTQSKSHLRNTSLATASAFLAIEKDLHSCKRPQTPRRKSAAPAQLAPGALSIPIREIQATEQVSLWAKVSDGIAKPCSHSTEWK